MDRVDELDEPSIELKHTTRDYLGVHFGRAQNLRLELRRQNRQHRPPLDLSGHPALTVPCGLGEHGLPVGLQIVGRHLDEYRLYEVGSAFEAAHGFESPAQTLEALASEANAGAA
jgi:Asp-tRNA(Asn)/Glu-tRNA(Gln) amidotransferase A subunit family amidase